MAQLNPGVRISEGECAMLADAAASAMGAAYCPYSKFKVGAALLAADGTIYTGCNIENASYGATICAERAAFLKAVGDGCRDFCAIAIAGGRDGHIVDFVMPCGICRQVMSEFCGPDFEIIAVGAEGALRKYTLGELLPGAFSLPHMVD